jgi:hypothetical protein
MLSLIPKRRGSYDDGYSKEKQELPSMQHYFAGKVYSYDWIAECIRAQRIMPNDNFELISFPYPDHQDQNTIKKQSGLSGQRTRFTMRELIKIFAVTQEFKSKKNKNQVYWQRFIKLGYFPGRSVNSVNAQWQRFCHYEYVEAALEKAMQLGMPYSTAFNHLPPTVDRAILSMKKECPAFLKQEISSHLNNFNPIQNYYSHNMHMKNVNNPEAKAKFYKGSHGHGRGKDDDYSDDDSTHKYEARPKSARIARQEETKDNGAASYAHFSHRLVAEKPSSNKVSEECSEDILSESESKKKQKKANEIKQIVKETKQIMSDSDDDVIKVKREAPDEVNQSQNDSLIASQSPPMSSTMESKQKEASETQAKQ